MFLVLRACEAINKQHVKPHVVVVFFFLFIFKDPRAEPAGQEDSRAPVAGPVRQQRGGTLLQPGQFVKRK